MPRYPIGYYYSQNAIDIALNAYSRAPNNWEAGPIVDHALLSVFPDLTNPQLAAIFHQVQRITGYSQPGEQMYASEKAIARAEAAWQKSQLPNAQPPPQRLSGLLEVPITIKGADGRTRTFDLPIAITGPGDMTQSEFADRLKAVLDSVFHRSGPGESEVSVSDDDLDQAFGYWQETAK
jgi:hypothetical protein